MAQPELPGGLENTAPHKRFLGEVFSDPQGHDLAVAILFSGSPVVICLKCGCWARRIPKGLRQPCTRATAAGGKNALRRIFEKGLHPDRRLVVDSVWRVPPGSLVWERVLAYY